jgi:hypothetical protein
VDLMKAGFGPDTTVTIDPAVKECRICGRLLTLAATH